MNPIRRLSFVALALGIAAASACAPLTGGGTRLPLAFASPDSFLVAFETTRGRFDVMAHSQWAPVGTDRFYELVHRRFYDDVVIYRVIKGFVAQFGINGDPAVSAAWRARRLADDPVRQGNKRGRLAFARGGAGTRTTQLYINYADNARLDTLNGFGFPAFAEVVSGMEVVDSLYNEYAARPASRQDSISRQGNAWLLREFPKLDRIKTARIVREWRRPPG
jgi:cyclophilin family peptidyl-prolyl cis-trans isomerase